MLLKGKQTCQSYKGELQMLTKLSMRHQVCPSETCCTMKEFLWFSRDMPWLFMIVYGINKDALRIQYGNYWMPKFVSRLLYGCMKYNIKTLCFYMFVSVCFINMDPLI